MHRHKENIRLGPQHFPREPGLRPPKRKRHIGDFIIFKFGKSQLRIELAFVVYQKSVSYVLEAEIFEKILNIYSCAVDPGVIQISGIDSDAHFYCVSLRGSLATAAIPCNAEWFEIASRSLSSLWMGSQ
jgi:hypothetical protein